MLDKWPEVISNTIMLHRWIGMLETFLMSLKFWRSANPVSGCDHLSNMLFLEDVLQEHYVRIHHPTYCWLGIRKIFQTSLDKRTDILSQVMITSVIFTFSLRPCTTKVHKIDWINWLLVSLFNIFNYLYFYFMFSSTICNIRYQRSRFSNLSLFYCICNNITLHIGHFG